jgi:CRISPR-associated protein Csb1
VLGQAVGSRIDPLGIEKLQLYQTPHGDWTAIEEKAARSNGKPRPYSKKRPSEINHGNIAPSVREQGITAERITLRWAMPMAAVRRLRFGSDERDAAGQAYAVALGVLARVLDHESGYSLRSRCDLINSGPVSIVVIDRDGAVKAHTITADDALALFREAENGLRRAGIALHSKITARPSEKLSDLIEANRRAQELEEEPAE